MIAQGMKVMVSPAARRTGVRYYLSFLTRCGVTGRLTNKVFVNEHTGKAVIAFDQDAANRSHLPNRSSLPGQNHPLPEIG